MFKKNSWIVALILALTLTAFFTGCIDAFVEEKAEFEEVELGEFNVWGGQNYQYGWASAGMKFKGVGDKPEVTKDKGYDGENFMKATKLKIEMEDSSHPSGNINLIWGAADDNGDPVISDWVQSGNLEFKKDGNTIILNLTDMKDYAKFKDSANGSKRKIIVQAGGESAGLTKLVKRAWLMIPTKEEPFVSVTGLTLTDLAGVADKAFELDAIITPANATVRNISWAIYLPNEQDPDANEAQADFADADTSFITPGGQKSKNKIMARAAGKVKVKATISSAVYDAENKKYLDFTKDFTLTFTNPTPLKYKVDGIDRTTKEYDKAVDAAVSVDPSANQTTPSDWIQLTGVDNYGGPAWYIGANLGNNTLGDFTGVKFTYNPSKDVGLRLLAKEDKPTSNIYGGGTGYFISALSGNASTGTIDMLLGNQGDIPVTEKDGGGGDLEKNIIKASKSNYVYYYFQPWDNAPSATYKFTNLEFYKEPLKYTLDGTPKTTTGLYSTRNLSNTDGVQGRTSSDGTAYRSSYQHKSQSGQVQTWFKVDLGTGKLRDYINQADISKTGTIEFKYKGNETNSYSSSTVRVKVTNVEPTSITDFNGPGQFISWTTATGDTTASAVTKTAKLGWNESGSPASSTNNIGNNGTISRDYLNASVVYVWIYVQTWTDDCSFTISDISFTKATEPTPQEPVTIFDLSTWIDTNSAIGDPFVNSGSPTIALDKPNKKIVISNIVNNWDALDIVLAKILPDLSFANYKVKIEVEGKILELTGADKIPDIATRGGQVRIQLMPEYGDGGASAAGIAADGTFSITTDYTSNNSNTITSLRLASQAAYAPNSGDTDHDIHDIPWVKSFEITKIVITNLGDK